MSEQKLFTITIKINQELLDMINAVASGAASRNAYLRSLIIADLKMHGFDPAPIDENKARNLRGELFSQWRDEQFKSPDYDPQKQLRGEYDYAYWLKHVYSKTKKPTP